MSSSTLRRREHERLVRLHAGEIDDLDRRSAAEAGYAVSHRRRAWLGMIALVVIAGILAAVCVRHPGSGATVEPGHVLPVDESR